MILGNSIFFLFTGDYSLKGWRLACIGYDTTSGFSIFVGHDGAACHSDLCDLKLKIVFQKPKGTKPKP